MIGDRIKAARTKLGYSAEQVAAFLGVSPATVYRYENGDISKLPSKYIKPLAEYLCVTPAYLMCWDDDKKYQMDLQLFNDGTMPHAVPETVTTCEARIISGGVDKMTPEERERALNIMRAAFAAYFKEDDNEP